MCLCLGCPVITSSLPSVVLFGDFSQQHIAVIIRRAPPVIIEDKIKCLLHNFIGYLTKNASNAKITNRFSIWRWL